mgnify:CR=1 FL=1
MCETELQLSTQQTNVLVVDDEAAIRDMIQFALEKAGMAVQTASNAHEAVVRINETRPDIILMDWMMPGVSGLELTRRLRKDVYTEDIPIIMLTAKVTEDDKVAGLEAGGLVAQAALAGGEIVHRQVHRFAGQQPGQVLVEEVQAQGVEGFVVQAAVLVEQAAASASPLEVVEGLIRPALEHIGERWAADGVLLWIREDGASVTVGDQVIAWGCRRR